MRTYVLTCALPPLILILTLAFDTVMDPIGHALDEIGNERDIKGWTAFFHSCSTTLSAVSAV